MQNTSVSVIFYKKYSMTLRILKHVVQFPDLSLQLKHANGKFECKMRELKVAHKLVEPPFRQIMISMSTKGNMSTSQITVEAIPSITRELALLLGPVIMKKGNNKTVIQRKGESATRHSSSGYKKSWMRLHRTSNDRCPSPDSTRTTCDSTAEEISDRKTFG